MVTNKAVQEAVRGFGQGPTNLALERAMDEIAARLKLDPLEVRRRNMIKRDEFPYTIPSGTEYDSGDYETVIAKVLADTPYEALKKERDALRAEGKLAGIGIAACLEPSGGNATFEALLNPKITTSTFMDSCRITVDGTGAITATMHTTSSGQGHETLVGTVVGEVLERRSRRGAGDAAGFAQLAAERHAGRQPHGDHAGRRRLPRGATS